MDPSSAGNFPRPHDAAGASALLHSQQRGADLGMSHGSHAAYKAWKMHGVPTAQHPSTAEDKTFGLASGRDLPIDLTMGAQQPQPPQQPPPLPQQQPRAAARSRNIITWDGEPEEAPRTTWDPLTREETRPRCSQWRTNQPAMSASSGWSMWQQQAAPAAAAPAMPAQPPPGSRGLAHMEKENPQATWGQLTGPMSATARKRAPPPSAALSMIDGLPDPTEARPNNVPRLPADNLNYLGMRLPGLPPEKHGRSYGFSSQFSDPFASYL